MKGEYTLEAKIDSGLLKRYLEDKKPNDAQLEAFLVAELAPFVSAVVNLVREHQRTKQGPWE